MVSVYASHQYCFCVATKTFRVLCGALVFLYFLLIPPAPLTCIGPGLLKLWVATPMGSRNVILGRKKIWLNKSDIQGFVNFGKKLKVSL